MMVGYDQLDYSNFFWRTQNSLFGVKYTKKGVECQKTLMITNSNQMYFAKVLGREVQEEANEISLCQFSKMSRWGEITSAPTKRDG